MFPKFMKLPYDVRHLIYDFSIDGRTITIVEGAQYTATWKCKPERKETPKLMLVCKDAQEIAKRLYKLSFKESLGKDSVWFNFNYDTLYLKNCSVFRSFYRGCGFQGASQDEVALPTDLLELESSLEHLALGGKIYPPAVLEAIGGFENLESLHLETKARPSHYSQYQREELQISQYLGECWEEGNMYQDREKPELRWILDMGVQIRAQQKAERTRDGIVTLRGGL